MQLETPTSNGGRRPGSGPKKGMKAARAAMAAERGFTSYDPLFDDPPTAAGPNEATPDYVDYTKERARNEKHKADMAELDFQIKSGQYIPRDEVRQACATALAAFSQSVQSVRDNLERRLSVSPEIADAVDAMLLQTMNTLADDFQSACEADYTKK